MNTPLTFSLVLQAFGAAVLFSLPGLLCAIHAGIRAPRRQATRSRTRRARRHIARAVRLAGIAGAPARDPGPQLPVGVGVPPHGHAHRSPRARVVGSSSPTLAAWPSPAGTTSSPTAVPAGTWGR